MATTMELALTGRLTQHELAQAREWIKECAWRDLECAADVDELTWLQVEAGVARHYAGGIEQFKRDGRPEPEIITTPSIGYLST